MQTGLVIFDLDGVLVETPDLHFDALNEALAGMALYACIISEEDRHSYEALPTREKLVLLGVPEEHREEVYKRKQAKTRVLLREHVKPDPELVSLFESLRLSGYAVAVASNAIRETLDTCLQLLGLEDAIAYSIAACEVEHPKPSPDMYFMIMEALEVPPWDTVIVEDSPRGLKAAHESGATVVAVTGRKDVTLAAVLLALHNRERLQVVIPAAGNGFRFADSHPGIPKPLIPVKGEPMIVAAVKSLKLATEAVTVVVPTSIVHRLRWTYTLGAIPVDETTEGAACTVLLAEPYILNPRAPLIIANCDQIIKWSPVRFAIDAYRRKADGSILTFPANDTRWSYALTGDDGYVTRVAEKEVISPDATVGVYFWRHAYDYFDYAERMIEAGRRSNGEFYVAPVYNEAIADGRRIVTYPVQAMYSVGTPEDLAAYEAGSRDDG